MFACICQFCLHSASPAILGTTRFSLATFLPWLLAFGTGTGTDLGWVRGGGWVDLKSCLEDLNALHGSISQPSEIILVCLHCSQFPYSFFRVQRGGFPACRCNLMSTSKHEQLLDLRRPNVYTRELLVLR